jgi:ATP-binding cassette subfamily F protein 3
MIQFKKLSLYRGSRALIKDADLVLHDGWKVGLTGLNGCGKSSLFSLIRGELHPESGEVDIPKSAVIAHVEQEVEASMRPAVEYVIDGDAELRTLEAEMARNPEGDELAGLLVRLEEIDGYGAKARASRLMYGLGFSNDAVEKPVSEFSGGWRMRLNLARALMCRSSILLLDEPTNHLDLEAVLWLGQWLRKYEGTLLLISHDRDFLNETVDSILHIEHSTIRRYAGNYDDFERQRAANLAQQQSAFERQQREVAHLKSYIDRFKAKATKARQAQSRIKALERMELISAAHVDSPFSFSFEKPGHASNPLLKLEKASAGYPGKTILNDVSLSIETGSRLALLGRNGAGKSTLIKLIAGEIAPYSGGRIEGRGLKIGYFAQHQLESLNTEESPMRHVQKMDEKATEQQIRDYLGGFGFNGDAVFSNIKHFSGGEKARLVLALIIREKPNLLLLDEPTNHLDLEMRHALTLALQDYEGAIVVVSHDRHLLRTVADDLLLVEDGRAIQYDADVEEYGKRILEAPMEAKPQKENRKRAEAESRARKRPLQLEIAKLEKEMERLGLEKKEIEDRLADPEFHEDREAVKSAVFRQAKIDTELSKMENEWLELHSELEAME